MNFRGYVNPGEVLCQHCQKRPNTRMLSHEWGWEDVCDDCLKAWCAAFAVAPSGCGSSDGNISEAGTRTRRVGVVSRGLMLLSGLRDKVTTGEPTP